MVRKSLLAAAFAVSMVGLTAAPALAGEVTGNGKPTQGPAHANSICVFSGQNDDPTAPIVSAQPTPEAPNGPGGRTQNFGQDVRHGLISPHVLNPGSSCQGGSNFARQ